MVIQTCLPGVARGVVLRVLLCWLLACGLAAAELAAETVAVKVEVTGVEGERRANVLALSSLARQAGQGELEIRQVERLFARAEREIAGALEPFGLYRPEVDSELDRDAAPWRAIYNIDPGPQIVVGELQFEILGAARQDDLFTALEVFFPLAGGTAFSHPEWQATKAALLDLGAERGYFDARLTVHQVRIDLDRYRADLELRYDSGPRYRYGEVRIEQDFLQPELIEAYVSLTRGAPVDLLELLRLQARLSGTPYFQGVEVRPLIEERAAGEVPIELRLVPRRRLGYEAGLGYGTDTGPRVTFALDLRRLNRRGHHALVSGKIAAAERRVTASYVLPRVRSVSSNLRLSAGWRELVPSSSDTQTSFLTLSRDRRRGRWGEVVSLSYQRHQFTIGNDDDVTRLLIPGLAYSRVEADDRRIATRGYRLSLELDGALAGGPSDAGFLRLRLGGKVVRKLAERWRVIGRGEVGYLAADDFRLLPPTVRFFTGGDGSVRGFGFQEIGARDELSDQLLGGKALTVLSAELEWRFFETWGAAVFLDAGNASDSFGDRLERGAGLGARWYLPIGLLRIDAAWALSRDSRPLRLHLGVGFDL